MPWTVCMSCMAPLTLGGESQHNLDSHTPLSHTRLYHNSAHTHTQLAGSHMHAPVAAPQAACSGCSVQYLIAARS